MNRVYYNNVVISFLTLCILTTMVSIGLHKLQKKLKYNVIYIITIATREHTFRYCHFHITVTSGNIYTKFLTFTYIHSHTLMYSNFILTQLVEFRGLQQSYKRFCIYIFLFFFYFQHGAADIRAFTLRHNGVTNTAESRKWLCEGRRGSGRDNHAMADYPRRKSISDRSYPI